MRYTTSPSEDETIGILPIEAARENWGAACVHDECTLHQMSPYIGKLKSRIAADLIENYSKLGDLVVDPFAGSFTVPLQAALMGRHAYGADISSYAFVLGKAKLDPPSSLELALSKADDLLNRALLSQAPDLRTVPSWVRSFFHPKTLKEAIQFADLCMEEEEHFFLACMLGILHHQRPGFLSYPSSHLVPYLRDRKFPKGEYPELYAYRDLRSRLFKKIERIYKRFPGFGPVKRSVVQAKLGATAFPTNIGCIITSPPYMNALDYGRDNRLRLWFIERTNSSDVDQAGWQKLVSFVELMDELANLANKSLILNGHCVVIVGDQANRGYKGSPVSVVLDSFQKNAQALELIHTTIDDIPDIRRARRDCRGIRSEHFLVFKKTADA